MSYLNYVAMYHRNSNTTIHALSSWEQIQCEFADENDRLVVIRNPFGGETQVMRRDIESIHLVTEDEVEESARRKAALEKAEDDAKEWGNR
jgi:hypothetical protein